MKDKEGESGSLWRSVSNLFFLQNQNSMHPLKLHSAQTLRSVEREASFLVTYVWHDRRVYFFITELLEKKGGRKELQHKMNCVLSYKGGGDCFVIQLVLQDKDFVVEDQSKRIRDKRICGKSAFHSDSLCHPQSPCCSFCASLASHATSLLSCHWNVILVIEQEERQTAWLALSSRLHR